MNWFFWIYNESPLQKNYCGGNSTVMVSVCKNCKKYFVYAPMYFNKVCAVLIFIKKSQYYNFVSAVLKGP